MGFCQTGCKSILCLGGVRRGACSWQTWGREAGAGYPDPAPHSRWPRSCPNHLWYCLDDSLSL